MPLRVSIYRWFMAQLYDAAMRKTEHLCLGLWRAELLADAAGEVLEIGAGTGANLPYYPATVSRLLLAEPDPHMRRRLHRRLLPLTPPRVELSASRAEQLGLPDASVDTAVSTLALCSVDDLAGALGEIRRVLRPGGRLIVLEHVVSPDPNVARWQRFCQPFWRACSGNCHLTRDTARAIQTAGFRFERLDCVQMRGVPAIVRTVLKGSARRAV